MKGPSRLLPTLGVAATVVVTACFALAQLKPVLTRGGQAALGLGIALLIPAGVARWMYGRLRAARGLREARAIAIAFAISAPIGLIVGLALAQIPGSYADIWFGKPFGLVGAFAGVVVAIALFSLVPCALTAWALRRFGGTGQRGYQ